MRFPLYLLLSLLVQITVKMETKKPDFKRRGRITEEDREIIAQLRSEGAPANQPDLWLQSAGHKDTLNPISHEMSHRSSSSGRLLRSGSGSMRGPNAEFQKRKSFRQNPFLSSDGSLQTDPLHPPAAPSLPRTKSLPLLITHGKDGPSGLFRLFSSSSGDRKPHRLHTPAQQHTPEQLDARACSLGEERARSGWSTRLAQSFRWSRKPSTTTNLGSKDSDSAQQPPPSVVERQVPPPPLQRSIDVA